MAPKGARVRLTVSETENSDSFAARLRSLVAVPHKPGECETGESRYEQFQSHAKRVLGVITRVSRNIFRKDVLARTEPTPVKRAQPQRLRRQIVPSRNTLPSDDELRSLG